MSAEQWAILISCLFGVLGTFVGAGMLWVASAMREDIKKLNDTVLKMVEKMMPREEAETKRAETERRMHARIDRVEDRIWGEHTDPGLGGRR